MVGWPLVAYNNLPLEESPGSMETRCRVIPGGGNPRESATESKPPGFFLAFGKGERGW